MCRFFGVLSDRDGPAHTWLCAAKNALQSQSRRHPDGWGIGWYRRKEPHLRRGLLAAHDDPRFARTAEEVRSTALIAHVRAASCGPVSGPNTHPFRLGRWLFCHNGTVTLFKRVRAALESEIDPDLRRRIRGDTDSERCFYLFLTRLRAHNREVGAPQLIAALAQTVRVVQRIANRPSLKPSSLNFLVTDGRLLAGCRVGRSLFLGAAGRRANGHGRAVALSSERIACGTASQLNWTAVPEEAAVAVDGSLAPVQSRLSISLARAR
jgi:glutamine amidotransferase